jgi:glycosyltransferase involved in cell wall biosynthesis
MKIFFDNCDLGGSRTGPNTFARRLAIELSKRGHTVADASDYDVAIVFIEKTSQLDVSKPYVHRLDGIWFRPDEIYTKNKNIQTTHDGAEQVIYQSQFDRTMAEKWFGVRDGVVIPNGIELVEPEISPDIQELKEKYSKIFVCSSNWHRQKRLRENIQLYMHLKKNLQETCCLVVLGSNPDHVVAGNDIFYTGASIPHEICLQLYAVADWMIHLAWADHCPNVVVEALSQGCPVICSETGGTKELVKDDGIVLKEIYDYQFEAFDYDSPPALDVSQLKMLPARPNVDRSRMDIDVIVGEYEKVLSKAVNSRTT